MAAGPTLLLLKEGLDDLARSYYWANPASDTLDKLAGARKLENDEWKTGAGVRGIVKAPRAHQCTSYCHLPTETLAHYPLFFFCQNRRALQYSHSTTIWCWQYVNYFHSVSCLLMTDLQTGTYFAATLATSFLASFAITH